MNRMASKCDRGLEWWIQLANLHRQEWPSAPAPLRPSPGFADQVRRLRGPRPTGIDIVLNPKGPWRDRLIGFGDDPDQCLWRLASVANSILSKLSELREAAQLPKEITIADWSAFTAPLILCISASGTVEEAHRPEPLASGLLVLLKHKNIDMFGTCPICGKLFQRLRRDQACDNRRCRDTFRQRRYRASQLQSRQAVPGQ
jgi:hypothetical protein